VAWHPPNLVVAAGPGGQRRTLVRSHSHTHALPGVAGLVAQVDGPCSQEASRSRRYQSTIRLSPREPYTARMTRILVVDDDNILLATLGRYLAPLAPVDQVATAQDARHMVARHRYDVVVMDLHVGHDDGIDIVQHLLAEQPHAVRAVVFHTGDHTHPAAPFDVPVPHVLVHKCDLTSLHGAVAARLRR